MALYFRTSNAGGSNKYFRTNYKDITNSIPEGWTEVTLSGTLVDASQRLKGTPDLVAGDKIAYGNFVGTGVAVVYSNGSYYYPNTLVSFDYMINDGTGYSAPETIVLAIVPTLVTLFDDVSSMEGQSLSLTLGNYFTDENSIAVSGLPSGSGLSLSAGVLSGTFNTTDVSNSPYNITVTATNAAGDTADTFAVSVVALAVPTLVTPVADQTWQQGTSYSISLANAFTGELDMYIEGLPVGSGLSLSDGMFGGVPTSEDLAASPITVTVTASNGYGIRTDTFIVNISAVPVNPGLRITEIYAPNSADLVGDVTGATAVIYDQLGGTELWQGTVNIVSGDLVIDNDAVGNVNSTVFLIVRWTGYNTETVYAATETVINLGT